MEISNRVNPLITPHLYPLPLCKGERGG